MTTGRTTGVIAGTAVLAALFALTGPAQVSASATVETACTAGTGPYQREMEAYLKRASDGVQTPADCSAVRAFQRRYQVTPSNGYAGLATFRTMVAIAAHTNPNAAGACPVRTYRVTCVDLTRQILWVQRGRRVVFAPVAIRTGRDGLETRRGWHKIYWRNKDHVSTIYNTPMPHAQFFDGGQALHGRTGEFFDRGGSGGCVNLTPKDAELLWNLLGKGDSLYIWGTKPGTED